MITDPGFTLQDAVDEICNGVIEAVAERPGEPEAVRLIRRQTVGHTVRSFQPRDPLEAMLAGHCVIFDQLVRDTMRDSIRGQTAATAFRTRNQIHGSGRMFLAHLKAFVAVHPHEAEQLAYQPTEQDRAPAEATPARGPDTPAARELGHAEPDDEAGVSVASDEIPTHRQSVMPDAPASQPAPRPIASRPATHVTRTATQGSAAHPGAQAPKPAALQETEGPAAVFSGTPPDLPEPDAIALPVPDAAPSAQALQQNPPRIADAGDSADVPAALTAAPPSGEDLADSAMQLEHLFRLAIAVRAEELA